jgi:hypothetical protein
MKARGSAGITSTIGDVASSVDAGSSSALLARRESIGVR